MSDLGSKIEKFARQYWVNHPVEKSECFGVHPMGGGGEFEVKYRHFFESRNFLKHVPITAKSNVLELGCGNGRWAALLAPLVGKYTGVDVNLKAVEAAASLVQSKGISNATFINQSIDEFIPNSIYDIVYLSGVSQYLNDDTVYALLYRLNPYLSQNAILIDRSTVNIKNRQIFTNGNYTSIFRTPAEIITLMSRNGWQCYFKDRSYRFMRATFLLCRGKKHSALLVRLLQLVGPVIFYVINGISLVADGIKPKPLEGNLSHDFLFFRR